MSRRWKIFVMVGVLSLLADQLTKIWARNALPSQVINGREYGTSVEFISGWWDWRLSFNPGAAFSMFHGTGGARVFLSVVGLIAVAAIIWMVYKARDNQRRLVVALGLIIGGALGNLIDRIAFGVVTDFVVWKYKTKEWPTFNVADVTLVAGVLLLFLDIGLQARRDKLAQGRGEGQDSGGTGDNTSAASGTTGAARAGKRASKQSKA